ncbi:hypothetical protein TVAG_262300 [Trichomonas vaginalis G3]|uniref:Uncharacterized protein n=1 Tax=Trichomonas vaginalis (strain ATCC PRA-98 / G3) TaxID=412133 RepID=A2DUE2_TRIV3|nr:hypothetical protein TVAGG3_0595980 [Trichomonas vaginalis G3]EAY15980.1 hypothetical protein TVAG_262300 [Trichomonas vaginalis G3]KAI5523615.1 hypothetical protein TVAGG3_0595980 [Trichomonas vaginalis G3]|eukprot:XP_001328203.1 hypothetical protein [Trichomonas vaginalis G3]
MQSSKWPAEPSLPSIQSRQPQGHLISFIITDGWGNNQVEIRNAMIQNADGSISEVLLTDKWFFNAESFPDTISFALKSTERPGFILFGNGYGKSGVRSLTVLYDNEQIWKGDLPMTNPNSENFPIAVPIKYNEFQKPDIKSLRSASLNFHLDLET